MAIKLEFRIQKQTSFGTRLVVVGSAPFLGAWNLAKAINFRWAPGDLWTAVVVYDPPHAAPARVEFKFAVVRDDGTLVCWENAHNHAASLPAVLPCASASSSPLVIDIIWGAAAEIDLRIPPHFSAQSPPPTPMTASATSNQGGDQIRRAVARLAGAHAENALTNGPKGATTETQSEPSRELVPVQFRIKYRVADGERIYVVGDIGELGKWDKVHAPRLAQPVSDRIPVESGLWVLDMHIPRDVAHTQFEYKYFTRKKDGSRRWEGGGNRVARPFDDNVSKQGGCVIWDDRWEKVRLDFSIYYPTKETEVMHITGDPPEIGAWFKPGPTPMKLGPVQTLETDVQGRKWHLSVWVDPEITPFSYRYIIMDSLSKRSLWEREPNRRAEFDPEKPVLNSAHIMRDVNFVSELQFDRVPPNMFIGPYPQTVNDIDTLAAAGITAVFNTQTDEDFVHRGIQWDLLLARYRTHEIVVVRYPIRDFDRISLKKRLQGAATELDELIRSDKQVYIHCTAGMGRAPACAVAYLCLMRNMKLDEAVAHVKKHRIVAVPNVPVLTEVIAMTGERSSDRAL